MSDRAARAVDWLERALPIVKAARFAMFVGALLSVAGALLAFGGFLTLGASGFWLVVALAVSLVLAVPAWLLWLNRAAMRRVLELPDALRRIGELDDELMVRVEAVKDSVTAKAGLVRAVRAAASIVDEARGSLDQELAPFAAAVGTLAPTRLAASAFAMLLAGGSLAFGVVVALLAMIL